MCVIAIDRDAFRPRAKIRAVTRCDHKAEMLVKPRFFTRGGRFRAAVVARVLERELFGGRFGTAQQRTRSAIRIRILGKAALCDPPSKVVAVEMRIAAVGQRSEGTVFEGE